MFLEISNYIKLLKETLFLNHEAFLELSQGDFKLAMLIVFLAGLSQALGQSIVLFINKVSKRRFVFSLLINAIIFSISFFFLVLSISVTVNFAFHKEESLKQVMTLTGLAYLPYLFSFLTLAPYFGSFVALSLSLWNLAAIITATSVVFSLNIYQALAASIIGWLLKQLLKSTIAKPIQKLSKIIKKVIAGKPLEFSKQKLREIINRGKK